MARRADGAGRAGVIALALIVAATSVPAGGCADDEGAGDTRPRTTAGSASGTIRPPDATRPVPPADETAGDSAAGADQGAWGTGETFVERTPRETPILRDVRVASHDGFDRVVLDFGAGPLPGYRIAYAEAPVRACGSGEEVALPGAAWLTVALTPAAAHDEAGHATVQRRDLALDMTALRRVRLTCDFEAVVEWVAAVVSPTRYRVLELTGPSRLVIDVRHP